MTPQNSVETKILRCGGFRLAWVCTTFLLMVSLGGGCRKPATTATTVDEAIVTVGERRITEADILQEVSRLKAAGTPVPAKEALVKQMSEHAALVQQALAAGIDKHPGVRRAWDDLLIAHWRDREMASRAAADDIGEEDLKREYERRRQDYITPAQVRLAVLQLTASNNMTQDRQAEVEARMSQARERILSAPAPGGRGPAATGFGALAIEHSDDQASRYRGGDIGWLDAGNFSYRWPRQVLATGCALEKGVPSEILRESDGYYLVMKTDERPGTTNSFESVKGALSRRLLVERQNRIRLELHQDAVAAFPAAIDQARLAMLKLPEPERTGTPKTRDRLPASPEGLAAP